MSSSRIEAHSHSASPSCVRRTALSTLTTSMDSTIRLDPSRSMDSSCTPRRPPKTTRTGTFTTRRSAASTRRQAPSTSTFPECPLLLRSSSPSPSRGLPATPACPASSPEWRSRIQHHQVQWRHRNRRSWLRRAIQSDSPAHHGVARRWHIALRGGESHTVWRRRRWILSSPFERDDGCSRRCISAALRHRQRNDPALETTGTDLWVGGEFSQYRGAPAYYFVRVDPISGAISEP